MTYTDDFAGTGALGGNWTDQAPSGSSNKYERVSDVAQTTTTNQANAVYSGGTFTDDQYAQCKVLSSETDAGPTVRASGSGASAACYFHDVREPGANCVLYYQVGTTTYTALQNESSTFDSTATYRIEAEGSTLRVYKNGAQIGSNQTHSTLATGKPGIAAYHAGGAQSLTQVDDWEGGDLGGGGGGATTELSVLLGEPMIKGSEF